MERKTERIYTLTACFDGYLEESLEGEIRLADYYPDAREILKTETPVTVTEGKISGDKVRIDGTLLFRVCYVSENKGKLGSVSLPLPFSKTFEAKRVLPLDAKVEASVAVRYQNARLINARRMEVKATVGISVTVKSKTAHEYLLPADDEVEFLTKEITVGNYIGHGEREQRVNEEIALPEGNESIGTLVRYDVFTTLTDVRVIPDKAVMKGEITLKLFYLTEAGEPAHFETSVPITQIAEVSGLTENADTAAYFEVAQSKVEPITGANGFADAVKLEALITSRLESYGKERIRVSVDAFSPRYDTQIKKSRLPSVCLVDTLTQEQSFRETLEYSPGEVARIFDLWGTLGETRTEISEQKATVHTLVALTVLAFDREGRLCSVESTVPVEAEVHSPEKTPCGLSPRVTLTNVSFTLTGENLIEVRGSVRVESLLTREEQIEAITDLTLSETPKENKQPPFIAYFASAGEPVWEIAKAHNTRVSDVLRDNGMEEDTVKEPRILRLFC